MSEKREDIWVFTSLPFKRAVPKLRAERALSSALWNVRSHVWAPRIPSMFESAARNRLEKCLLALPMAESRFLALQLKFGI